MFSRQTAASIPNPVFYGLLTITVALVLFGGAMIFSASQIVAFAQTSDSYYYLKKQVLAMVAGFAALVFFARVNYAVWERWAGRLVGLSILLLSLVLVFGTKAGGARGWFDLGFFSFQPSEFAKICLLIFLASTFSRTDRDVRDIKGLCLPALPVAAVIGGLLMAQPDFGAAFVIGATTLIVAFVGGAQNKHLGALMGAGAGIGALFVLQKPYIIDRFFGFWNAWGDRYGDGYHIVQSLIALGSGGPAGLGLGMSRQKFFYLPAGHTDFILSIIGEELGLGGTLGVVAVFVLFAYLGVRACFSAKDAFGKILAAGLVSLVLFQAVLNMGVAVGLLPITGVTLPLVSFGGSSLLFTMMAVGILLNIASQGRDSRRQRSNEGGNLRGRDGGSHLSRSGARAGAH